ncbi:MAG: hypothetical protein M3R65_05745 [Gemmatimonadota bacterium]|nr:hypothetical protein [Gemmatimonadota bacterium]
MTARSLLIGALAFFMAAVASPLRAQVGTTTDVIVGRVVGPDSLGLRGAHVDVTSIESGITRKQATGDDGRFSVVFPDGGGRYVVSVHYLGMAPVRMLLERRADEDRLVANFVLAPSAIVLSAVTVEAQRIADSLGAGAGAVGQVLSRELLEQLGYQGNEAAALALITPGVTLTRGADSSLSAISIGGQPASQTGQLIDGLAAGKATLPPEAVKNTSVITSTYDVSTGQYTGGFFETSTESGTNQLRATVNSSTPISPVGLSGNQGALTQTQKGFDLGGNLSGPLVRDHLFGSLAVHARAMHFPRASIYTLGPASFSRLGISPDSVNRFLSILDANGIAPPEAPFPTDRQLGNRQLFGRMDFTPSEKHTITLSANEFAYWTHGGFSTPLSTPTSGGEYNVESWRTQVSLTSHLGSWVNDGRVSASSQRYGATALLQASSASVVVPTSQAATAAGSGISTLSFGGSPFAASATTSTTIDAKDELSWLSGDGAHRAKIGASLTLVRGTGGVPGNTLGSYRFNSLADLQSGTPASYSRTLAPTDQASASSETALYVGDAWRTGPRLQLVYGARLEHSSFADPPLLNSAAAAAFGINTNRFPSETRVSPRIGFTYFVGAGEKKPAVVTIRGGVGFFRSGASQVSTVFASARDATGLANGQAELNCVGAGVPPLDWNIFQSAAASFPTSCAGGVASTPVSALPRIVAFDPSFELPRTLRASLNVSRQFAKIWNVSLDGSMTSGYAGTALRDLNLVAAPRFTLANEENRPVYVAPSAIVPTTGAISLNDSRVNPAFGTVGSISSFLRSENRGLSVSIGRMNPKLSITASYAYSYSRTQLLGTSLGALGGGFFNFGGSTRGDPRAPEWVTEPWDSPHQLRLFASYRPRSWLAITPSMSAQSGSTFGPIVSGDVNGDGAPNDRAFVFDPAHTADTAVANGMSRLIAAASPSVRKCLVSQLGRIASADTCRESWFTSAGLTARVTPPWGGGRLTVTLQTNNVPAGLDLLLHGSDNLRGWGQYPQSNATLLYVRGFDPVTRMFRYAVNDRFGTVRANQTLYLQPMQFTLVAQITLGKMGGGGPMGGMMPMGAPHAGVASSSTIATHADSLRTKILATMPNVFRRVLALKDSLSLGLDTAQVAQLRVLGDAYQPRADSLAGAIVAAMTPTPAGADPSLIAAKVRGKTEEANALRKKVIEDLRRVLTETQLKKLPTTLTDPGK